MQVGRRSGTDKEKGMKCSETCVLGSSTEWSFSCVASSRPTWYITSYIWRHKLQSVQRLNVKDNVTCCSLLSCISRECISGFTTDLNHTTGKVDYSLMHSRYKYGKLRLFICIWHAPDTHTHTYCVQTCIYIHTWLVIAKSVDRSDYGINFLNGGNFSLRITCNAWPSLIAFYTKHT
jgi:hypothetical protein